MNHALWAFMSLLTLVIVIVLVGVLLWALNTYVPMDAKVQRILNIVVVVVLVLWVLQSFGIFAQLGTVRVR